MDAQGYLRKQGWLGEGHSLDHTGRGIRKPLLITYKTDQLGLGKKKAAQNVSDQWWMRAFDESLKTIGTGKESALAQIRETGIKQGGLYSFFEKGEPIASTISGVVHISGAETSHSNTSLEPSRSTTPATSVSEPADEDSSSAATKKRKRDDTKGKASKKQKVAETGDSQAVQKTERKQAKKERKAARELEAAKEQTEGKQRTEDPVEREARRKAKKMEKARKEQQGETTATLDEQDTAVVAEKLASLSKDEKAQYASRAAAKNQSLDEYILRRIQKKSGKHSEQTKAAAATTAEDTSTLGFVIDTVGDKSLLSKIPAPALVSTQEEVGNSEGQGAKERRREARKKARIAKGEGSAELGDEHESGRQKSRERDKTKTKKPQSKKRKSKPSRNSGKEKKRKTAKSA